jgi:hypothetical protein
VCSSDLLSPEGLSNMAFFTTEAQREGTINR